MDEMTSYLLYSLMVKAIFTATVRFEEMEMNRYLFLNKRTKIVKFLQQKFFDESRNVGPCLIYGAGEH